ncbi:metal-sensitive transcriptional regulator [Brevundimonas sanguinis]|nr:metal-sensitive transcriptional regulator [Brevundimonas sp. NCCP 15609]
MGGISQDTRLGYMGVLRRTGRMQTDTKPKVLNRLSRIEGQVRGISRMVEDDRYCVDLLTQLQAVRAALHRVETEVLRDHLDHCVMGAMTGDDPEDRKAKAGELIELLARAGR